MIDYQQVHQSKKIEAILLFLFLIVQIYGFYEIVNFFLQHRYLPSPFIFNKSDTFMDLFYSAYWAGNESRYSDWLSVYPPLNFILLNGVKLVFLGKQSFTDPYSLRESGLAIEIFFVIFYLMIPLLVLKTKAWKNFSCLNKSLLYFIFILSSPMLFTLERGNFIIVTLVLLALAISHTGVYRSILFALLINIKPYFFVLTLLFLIKGRWKEFFFCVGVAASVFLTTGLLLDSNFLLFFVNILNFSSNNHLVPLRDILSVQSSISAYSAVFRDVNFESSRLYSVLPYPQLFLSVIEFLKWTVISIALVTLFKTSKKITDQYIIAILVVVISNLSISVGGYTLILYFTLIPIFFAMRFRWFYLATLTLIYTNTDFFPLVVQENLGFQFSFLSNSVVNVSWTLGLNNFLKPMLNITLLSFLVIEIMSGIKLKDPKKPSALG